MESPAQLTEYGKILSMAIVGVLLVSATILLAKLIAPKNPSSGKSSTYECGEEAMGTAWVQINPRFYVIALVFLLFDVELVFVFPWATVFGKAAFIASDARWGWFALAEMGIFIGILAVGLVYVWKRGDISWIKPAHVRPSVRVGIPAGVYQVVNQRKYPVRDYKAIAIAESKPETGQERGVPEAKPAPPKMGFRPKFAKPKATT